jgi:hypothetical protein
MPTFAQIKAAHEAERKSSKLTPAEEAHNQKAREHNRQLIARLNAGPKLNRHEWDMAYAKNKMKMAYTLRKSLNDEAKKILEHEIKSRKMLSHRLPSTWESECMKLEPGLREAVASIVWWDYFGVRGGDAIRGKILEPWHELDDLIADKPPLLPPKEIEHGLVRVGYSKLQAHRRIIFQ